MGLACLAGKAHCKKLLNFKANQACAGLPNPRNTVHGCLTLGCRESAPPTPAAHMLPEVRLPQDHAPHNHGALYAAHSVRRLEQPAGAGASMLKPFPTAIAVAAACSSGDPTWSLAAGHQSVLPGQAAGPPATGRAKQRPISLSKSLLPAPPLHLQHPEIGHGIVKSAGEDQYAPTPGSRVAVQRPPLRAYKCRTGENIERVTGAVCCMASRLQLHPPWLSESPCAAPCLTVHAGLRGQVRIVRAQLRTGPYKRVTHRAAAEHIRRRISRM